ncbi:MAG TPA: glycosyltransferase family 2 protein [Steroidobacteraceae bacterium]|nr:glycosyltransferase family 2 protein [Steroidobacteraceae bacterium]
MDAGFLMVILEILLIAIGAILTVPALILFAQVTGALLHRHLTPEIAGPRPRVAILMPAHDEAVGIGRPLQLLLQQLLPTDRLVVVADNCSDETARIASAAGAEVIERQDPTRRGKGFALDFGVRHLERDPPQVVIIADADCDFAPGAVDRLARECQARGRPVQALYLMLSPEDAGTRTRIAQFAWLVKNLVRPSGFKALGLPCHLMGSGMAFPWGCIRSAQLATGHIVEDMQLGLELARTGQPTLFCPDALVTSSFPKSEDGIRSQRTRWEHGHLGLILTDAPKLILNSVRRADIATLALALDLLVPPLALLVMLVTFNTVLGAVFAMASGRHAPLISALTALALVAGSVLLAWFRYGRRILSLYTLASAPVYALRKIPIYISFMLSRQLDWVRSKRDP